MLTKSLATPEYDYPSQEWFTRPIELEEGYWSEPYVDEGGGNILMTTFSMPIRDEHGVISAVLTADISLDWLTDLVGNISVYPKAFSILASRSGKLMVCPAESLIMHRTVQEAADDLEDSAAAHRILAMSCAVTRCVLSFSPCGLLKWVLTAPTSFALASIVRISV